MDRALRTGWFGKLPSVGDFVSRGLDQGFVDTWDAWLSEGLAQMQQQRGDWLQVYLRAPSWRFLLRPGALGPSRAPAPGPQAWAGVLLPSVDRVGRYFPLSVVTPLYAAPACEADWQALWRYLGRLDDLAADAIDLDWSPDQVDAELVRAGQLCSFSADRAPDASNAPVESSARQASPSFVQQGWQAWQAMAPAQSLWCCPQQEGLFVDTGLPSLGSRLIVG